MLAVAIFMMVVLSACGSPTPEATAAPSSAPTEAPAATAEPEAVEVTLTFMNNSNVPLDYYWVNPDGTEEKYGTIEAGGSMEQPSYFEHEWRVRD